MPSLSRHRRSNVSCIDFQALTFAPPITQMSNGIQCLQVEQHAEVQRQEWSVAAGEYERKLATVSSELRSSLDAAER